MKRLTIASLVVAAAFTVRSETVAGLEQYGSLTLVDSIECSTKSGHRFSEYPQGRSLSEKRLGADCLTLTHVKKSESGTGNESGAYVTWRLGEGKSLVPKAAYLLVVEYPDDAPRTFTLGNRGTGSRTCVHTGFTIGDSLTPPYVTQHPESYNVPLSGQFQRIEQVMYLMEKPESLTDGNTHLTASTDGFDIFFALYPQEDAPDSVGLALKSVKLYKIDNPALLETSPVYPADGLPRRYVTWREEMADDGGYAAFSTPVDYYATKAKLMKVLGFNCASRDLLEFGHCQYWDIWIDEYGWQWIWGVDADKSKYWEDTITAFANEGHTILPYYEYSGARGGTGSLGYQKLCTPLNHDAKGNDYFVEASSDASDAMVDITSSDAINEFVKILDCTILRFKDKAHFRGAWLRNRGSMPVSFHDNTIKLFNQETGNNTTREKIYKAGETSQIYKDYLAWWYGKRARFLEKIRDYLRQNGVAGAETFFDNDISEPGRIWEGWRNNVAADSEAKYNNKTWQQTVGSIGWSIDSIANTANSWAQYGPMGKYPTYDNYEHHHGCPTEDPATYASRNGVGLALSCGKVYMQIPSATVSSFRNGDDRLFLSHHYSLNEDAIFDANGNNRMLGYFTADTDHAGRASMLPQLWAMAINDPTDYGYLYGAAMESAYAPAMREFNLNFLALPAKKGTVMQGGAWGQYQTVRRYDSASTNIVYWALVNTSTESVTTEFKLSDSTTEFKKVKAVIDGTEYNVTNGKVSLTMKPLQLLSLSSEVSAENPPEEPTLQPIPDGAVSVAGFNGGYDGGENHRISVAIAEGYNFLVEYALSENGPWSTVNPGRLNVGTSEVWYRVSADGYVPLVGSATVVVTKAGNRWTTEPAIAGWTEGDTPSTPAGHPLFGDTTLVITYSGTTAKGESVSGASSVNAAGSYTAHFVVPDNTNWEGLSKDVNFTIAAKQVDPPTEPEVDPSAASSEFTWSFPSVATTPTAEICTFLYGKTWAYSFEMDDNAATDYTIAKPLFEKLRMTDGPSGVTGNRTFTMPGTLGIFAVAIDNGKSSVNITSAQLKELVASGWSVSNHGYWSSGNHWDATKANDEAMYRREFFWGQFFISQYVWDGKRACTSMVYPSGDPGYKTYFDDYGIIVGTLVGGTPQNVLAAHDGVRKVNWLDAGRTNLDNGDWKSDYLHNVPSSFVEGDWFIDFTHGIGTPEEDSTFLAISNRLEYINRTWGAKGADDVWLATSDRVAQYRKAAEAAQVTITKNKVTVTLPETALQSPLTLKISGIPNTASLTAPAGGSVYRDSANNVYLTTPVIGTNITQHTAGNLVKVHNAEINIGANQIVPQEITFEEPVMFAGMRLRQFGDLPQDFDINLRLVKANGAEVPFNFAKYNKYVKLGNVWGSWNLFPQLPDEDPVAITAIRYNGVQAFKEVEVWAVDGEAGEEEDDPIVDPPIEPEEPVEQPTNATMQAWFAYTAATEQVVGGAWQAVTEDGVKVFLPTAASKDGDLVYVDVAAKFPSVAASKLPASVSAQGAISAADGYLYVFAADGWTKLANATVAADTEKSYRVEFDYGSANAPRLRVWEVVDGGFVELKDANGTSWFALTANTFKCFTSLSFSGDGTIGDFIGTCETGPRVVVTIEVPSFTDADGKVKGGVSLRTVGDKNVFSVTIANGKKGAHYTAFVANTLSADQQDWTAVAASVSPDADGLLTLDIIRDDSPAKFAKIVATPTEVKAGTKLSELAQ